MEAADVIYKSNGSCIGRNVFDTLVIEKHCIIATLLQNFVFPFLFALTAYIQFFPWFVIGHGYQHSVWVGGHLHFVIFTFLFMMCCGDISHQFRYI